VAVASERRFELPLSARAKFGDFLRSLEKGKQTFQIVNYGISMAPFEVTNSSSLMYYSFAIVNVIF
jgi:hypothetical protein